MKFDMTVVVGNPNVPLRAVDKVAWDMYSGEPYIIKYDNVEYQVYSHTVDKWDDIATIISCLHDHMENVDIAEMEILNQYDMTIEVGRETVDTTITIFPYYGPNAVVEVYYVGTKHPSL
jgi:hypothetical protein